jgi:sugar lactone lactonase YvrE
MAMINSSAISEVFFGGETRSEGIIWKGHFHNSAAKNVLVYDVFESRVHRISERINKHTSWVIGFDIAWWGSRSPERAARA